MQKYGYANQRPILFPNHNIALLLTGRAGSTFAMKWYMHQNKMESEYPRWIHNHRNKVILPSEWHGQRCEELANGAEFTMVRFTRNPFNRAVSSYLHSIRNPPVFTPIVDYYDMPADSTKTYTFVEFLNYLAQVGPTRVNQHLGLQANFLESIHELDAFCRIEDGLDGLNAFERTLGLDEVSGSEYVELRASGHHIDYAQNPDSSVPNMRFGLGERKVPYPSPDRFYDEQTEPMVRQIFAEDFERFGYSTALPDLRPKQRVSEQPKA